MFFQSDEFINILIIVMFFGSILLAWFLLCLFKYKKWHDRKLNCTKKLVAHVVEIREKKTARSGIITKPIFQVCDGGKVYHIESAYYSNLIVFHMGQNVELWVNPKDYSQFLYADDQYNRGKVADILCCLIPLIFLIIIMVVWMAGK